MPILAGRVKSQFIAKPLLVPFLHAWKHAHFGNGRTVSDGGNGTSYEGGSRDARRRMTYASTTKVYPAFPLRQGLFLEFSDTGHAEAMDT